MPPIRNLIGILVLLLALALPRLGMAQATVLPPGEQCFQATTATSGGVAGTGTGMIGLLGTITAGTGGTAGTYGGVTLTGSMSGQTTATANITVAGGVVTAVVILNPGSQYVAGDVLTATSSAIGNVSGFSVPVSSVSINSSLAGGTVGYYIPSTNTFKQTWRNAGQTILNTNPVNLDANGCAIVYGSGIYRQILKDSLGNTVWDQLTASTNQNNPFWAGLAGGTANAITVVDTAFAGVDGSIINFTPLLNNTAATTLNPSSFGNIPIVKDTTAGPVALTGGEIVTALGTPNVVSVIYSATQANFHLLNTAIPSAANAQAPLCGATGLKMVNGASSSTITVTATQIVTATATGLIINRSNVSFPINITLGTSTSTAGGMDGEGVGSNAWIDVFAIDNGAAINGLASAASGNALSPALPTGYSYKCYLGAFRVNGSGNLIAEIIRGNKAQWVVGGANLTVNPNIANGVAGTFGNASPVLAAVSVTSVVPPTATRIFVSLTNTWKGGTISSVLVTPNTSWGGTNNGPTGSNGNVYPCGVNANVPPIYGMTCELVLEATTIAWTADQAGGAISSLGWEDSVNAN